MNIYHVKDEAGHVSVAMVEAETAEAAVAAVKSELPEEHKALELEAKIVGTLPHKTPAPDEVETKPE